MQGYKHGYNLEKKYPQQPEFALYLNETFFLCSFLLLVIFGIDLRGRGAGKRSLPCSWTSTSMVSTSRSPRSFVTEGRISYVIQKSEHGSTAQSQLINYGRWKVVWLPKWKLNYVRDIRSITIWNRRLLIYSRKQRM